MRFTAAFIAAMAVLISGSNAAPIDDKCTPAEDELNRFPVVTFTSWITDCGDKTGHTMGMNLVYRKYAGLCLPLPDDIRGLEVQEVTQGCRITAYRSPICDDYPYNGAWRNQTGCLWAGNAEFRSYKLTCDN